jgi:phosphoribosylanthranilate isomerase
VLKLSTEQESVSKSSLSLLSFRSNGKQAIAVLDAFITDTFDPETGASAATAKTHDWRVSRRLIDLADRPVFLTGGLTPEEGVDSHNASKTHRPEEP